jgi:hypothetical protein
LRTENEVGEAMQEVFRAGKIKREDVFVATTLWNTSLITHPSVVLTGTRPRMRVAPFIRPRAPTHSRFERQRSKPMLLD